MSEPLNARDGVIADFREREASFPGAHIPWLQAFRRQALESFEDAGFPTPRNEDWKYTDVRPIVQRRLVLAPQAPAPESASLRPFRREGLQLVFVDGRYAPSLSHAVKLPAGVQVMSLADALARGGASLEPWLGRCTPHQAHGFAALNAAFLQEGAFVHVARGAALDTPIELLFVGRGGADTVSYVRNLIVAGAGSRATVVERYVSLGAAGGLTNGVTEVALGAGAVLEHYRLGQENEAACHVGGTGVHQERDSRYSSHVVALGARLARHELNAVLDGEGAECLLNGLYVTRGRQHVDNHTRIDHRRPRGTSREWYKGVLDGQSRGVFSGRIVVHPDARKTDAEQSNHNLLLSREAEADSRPQLEIYADDVKCAHGSTAGSLDLDALFYLRSRAIDEALARDLLVYAFASDVLARMRLAPLRAELEQRLAERLAAPAQVLEAIA